jgi:hypothetical protein
MSKYQALKTCKACGWPGLTWVEAKQSYGHMLAAGFSVDEAKNNSPICKRCCTSVLMTNMEMPKVFTNTRRQNAHAARVLRALAVKARRQSGG